MVEINGDITQDIPANTSLRSVVNRSPELKRIVDNPELADNLTLEQSQKIINQLKSKLPPIKLKGLNVRPDDIPLFDLIDDIRGDQLAAFPEKVEINNAYGEVMNRYNMIKNKIGENSIKKNILNKFGGEPLPQQAFEKLLSEDLLKEVKSFRMANKMLKAAGLIGAGTAVGTAGKIGYGLIND